MSRWPNIDIEKVREISRKWKPSRKTLQRLNQYVPGNFEEAKRDVDAARSTK
jgi:hypothetical protein